MSNELMNPVISEIKNILELFLLNYGIRPEFKVGGYNRYFEELMFDDGSLKEFGPDFITVTDEDGNDIELELVDVLEHNGQTYMAFYPAVEEGEDEDSEEFGMVILKSIVENGEELLSTLDSDEELNEVYDLFMERLFEDEEEE